MSNVVFSHVIQEWQAGGICATAFDSHLWQISPIGFSIFDDQPARDLSILSAQCPGRHRHWSESALMGKPIYLPSLD